MKKLVMTIAIVLSMGATAFAQDVEVYEERGLFGMGKESGIFGAKAVTLGHRYRPADHPRRRLPRRQTP